LILNANQKKPTQSMKRTH